MYISLRQQYKRLKWHLRRMFYAMLMLTTSAILAGCVTTGSASVQLVSNDTLDGGSTPLCRDVTSKVGMPQQPSFQKVSINHVGRLNPDDISLLNWNIYKGNGEEWERDLSHFARNHNLMTIQEAYLDESLLSILQENGFEWVMNAAFHLDNLPAGVMNLADVRPVRSCGFKTKEPIIRVPKSVLVSYYDIDGHDEHLLVANIHGINFTLGLDVYRQQLRQLHDAIMHHEGPMIVAGDFNSWSEERFLEVEQLLDDLSLSSLKYKVNNKTHIFGNALDHVFYRQLEPMSNQVVEVSSSDHNPISVSFRLKRS
jgi:endonuclease/exonuclease/phosphatase (EEP) superfamily protein YafD